MYTEKTLQKLNQLFATDLLEVVNNRHLQLLADVMERAWAPERPTEQLMIPPKNFATNILDLVVEQDWEEGALLIMKEAFQHGAVVKNIDLAGQYGAKACLAAALTWLDGLPAHHGWDKERKMYLEMAMEGAMTQGHVHTVIFLDQMGVNPWAEKEKYFQLAVRNNRIQVVERIKHHPDFCLYHHDVLMEAATQKNTSQEMMDCLFDLDVARTLMTNPDMHFDRRTTNVYFLELYEAQCIKKMLTEELPHCSNRSEAHKTRKI